MSVYKTAVWKIVFEEKHKDGVLYCRTDFRTQEKRQYIEITETIKISLTLLPKQKVIKKL